MNTRATHLAQVERMAGLARRLDTVQGQIATGKRISVPSDDPVGSGIAAALRRQTADTSAQLRAIDTAASRLSAADTALGSVGTVLQRAREIALQGANATLNPADRATLAAEAAALGEQLLALANGAAADGTPLFGGAGGAPPAFARDATGAVVWQGSGAPPVLALTGGAVAAGVGPEAFTGPDADAFALLDDLAAALTAPDVSRDADLQAALAGLEIAGSRAADAQARIGTLGARLDAEGGRLRADRLRLDTDLGRIEGADLAVAIAELQRLSTVLQATQASFVALGRLSLWDRL